MKIQYPRTKSLIGVIVATTFATGIALSDSDIIPGMNFDEADRIALLACLALLFVDILCVYLTIFPPVVFKQVRGGIYVKKAGRFISYSDISAVKKSRIIFGSNSSRGSMKTIYHDAIEIVLNNSISGLKDYDDGTVKITAGRFLTISTKWIGNKGEELLQDLQSKIHKGK